MKKSLASTTLFVALALGIASSAVAKSEKKAPPKNTKAVEAALKEAGPEHMPEKMKVSKVGSIKVGDTYYHAFAGYPKKANPRTILFDNKQKYLGYYESEYEPSDYEEGAILLDSGDSDEDGNTTYYYIKIGAKGLSEKVRLDDGSVLKLVKAPEKKAGPAPVAAAAGGGAGITPEYREWTIRVKSREMKFTAIYMGKKGNKVTLKEQKRGLSNDFPITALSKADQEYLKQFK